MAIRQRIKQALGIAGRFLPEQLYSALIRRVRPGTRIASLEAMRGLVQDVDSSRPEALEQAFSMLRGTWFDLPAPRADPWSAEYRDYWMRLYAQLTGAQYRVERERTTADGAVPSRIPFPYNTRSPNLVGEQLTAIGNIVRAMALAPGAAVLELGAGWGNTTMILAQMGHKVTVIDVAQGFIELLRERATALGVEVELIQGDYFAVRSLAQKFDAVLFYESFHHCDDHLALLDEIPRLLRPGGKLVLAGETINEAIPYPWGLNPSGEAMWHVLRKGWLELAFRESYLLETLRRRGWATRKHECALTDAGLTYVSTLKAA